MTSTDHGHGSPVPAVVRPTRQRQAVADTLASFSDFRSAQDIHALLGERGEKVGLATVYRTLQLLSDSGDLDMIRNEEGEALYRRCGMPDHHHHHLVCRTCGATVEVEGPAVERWTKAVADRHGYADISHTLELFGTCPRCVSSR